MMKHGMKSSRTYQQHNLSKTRLYKIWDGMKQRCYNPNDTRYTNYGARGISICDEWEHKFKAFYDWAMKNGYDDTLSIDRIDIDGNYCPENCRWATSAEQMKNRRNNVYVEYDGKVMCLSDAAKASGINKDTLKSRYYAGDRGKSLFRLTGRYIRKNKK